MIALIPWALLSVTMAALLVWSVTITERAMRLCERLRASLEDARANEGSRELYCENLRRDLREAEFERDEADAEVERLRGSK